jgi:hypothetical protein
MKNSAILVDIEDVLMKVVVDQYMNQTVEPLSTALVTSPFPPLTKFVKYVAPDQLTWSRDDFTVPISSTEKSSLSLVKPCSCCYQPVGIAPTSFCILAQPESFSFAPTSDGILRHREGDLEIVYHQVDGFLSYGHISQHLCVAAIMGDLDT